MHKNMAPVSRCLIAHFVFVLDILHLIVYLSLLQVLTLQHGFVKRVKKNIIRRVFIQRFFLHAQLYLEFLIFLFDRVWYNNHTLVDVSITSE